MIADDGRSARDDGADITERLLRLAGAREAASPEREARVRDAVFEELHVLTRRRKQRRRMLTGIAALGAAAAVVLALWLGDEVDNRPVVPRPSVAAVVRVEGGGARAFPAAGSSNGATIVLDTVVREGDRIETDGGTRVGLRLANGASMRVDRGTRLVLTTTALVELHAGAIYVDSERLSRSLEIAAGLSRVRDIGTQFETRVDGQSLRVRVRSGLVEIHRGGEIVAVRPGAEVALGPAGTTTRPIDAFGPEWSWTATLAPSFEIEGRPLSAYLDFLCREQGWTLRYADALLARTASGIILHGSVNGLSPTDALAVVLETSALRYRLEGGDLLVWKEASDRR